MQATVPTVVAEVADCDCTATTGHKRKQKQKQPSAPPLEPEDLEALLQKQDAKEVAEILQLHLHGKEHPRLKAIMPAAMCAMQGDIPSFVVSVAIEMNRSTARNKVVAQRFLFDLLEFLAHSGEILLFEEHRCLAASLVRSQLRVPSPLQPGVDRQDEAHASMGMEGMQGGGGDTPALELVGLFGRVFGVFTQDATAAPPWAVPEAEVLQWLLETVPAQHVTPRVATLVLSDLSLQSAVPLDFVTQFFYLPLLKVDQQELCNRFAADNFDRRCALIDAMAESKKDKAASRLIEAWGYAQSDFPRIVQMRKEAAMRWAISKKELDMCLEIGRPNSDISEPGLRALREGACDRAVTKFGGSDRFVSMLVSEWGLQTSFPAVKAVDSFEECIDEPTGEGGPFLSVESVLDPDRISVVLPTDEAAMKRMRSILLAEPVVGLDTEWKPVLEKGGEQRCALLQLSGQHDVFLLDVVEGLTELADECLRVLFSSRHILKVGYAIKEDFKNLAHAFPESRAMDCIISYVDLGPLHHGLDTTSQEVAHRGLSGLSCMLLGLPLDKTCRMSNWDRRPLSARQIAYAALDAWVPMQITNKLLEDHCYDGISTVVSLRDEAASVQHETEGLEREHEKSSKTMESPATVIHVKNWNR